MILTFLYYLRLRGLVVYGAFLRLVRRSAWLFTDLSCCPVFLFEIFGTFRFIAIKPKLRKNKPVYIIHKLDLPEPLSWLTATIVLKSDKNLNLRKSLMLCWRFCCLSSVYAYDVQEAHDPSWSAPLLGSLSTWRLWAKRKWAVFLFKLSSHHHIIVKYLFTSRED